MKLSVKYIKVILVVILLLISGKVWGTTYYYAKLTVKVDSLTPGHGKVYASETSNAPSNENWQTSSSEYLTPSKSLEKDSCTYYAHALPDNGYDVSWKDDKGNLIGRDNPLTVSFLTLSDDSNNPTNIIRVASFTPKTYTITLDPAGGTLPSDTETDYNYTIEDSKSITLPSSMSRNGYDFKGWKVTSATEGKWEYGATPSGTISLNGKWGNATITAQWAPVEYTITLDAAGGKPESGTMTTEYKYKIDGSGEYTSITLPSSMSRDGYEFNCWKVTSAEGSWKYGTTPSGTISLDGEWGNATITAQWEAKVYTITLDPDGGILPSGTKTEYEYKTDGTGSDTVLLLPNLEKDGYHFYGWIVDKAKSSGTWNDKEGILKGEIPLTDEWGDAEIIAQWGAIPGYVKITVEGQKDADYSIFDVYKEEVKLYSVAVSSSEVLVIPEVGKIKVEPHTDWPKLYTFNTVDPKEVLANETVEFKFTASPSGQTNVFETTLGF